jgi:hypothetical protein
LAGELRVLRAELASLKRVNSSLDLEAESLKSAGFVIAFCHELTDRS